MAVFEFDKHEAWEPLYFPDWMQDVASKDAMQAAARPQEYQHDARDIFVDAIGKDELMETLWQPNRQHIRSSVSRNASVAHRAELDTKGGT